MRGEKRRGVRACVRGACTCVCVCLWASRLGGGSPGLAVLSLIVFFFFAGILCFFFVCESFELSVLVSEMQGSNSTVTNH